MGTIVVTEVVVVSGIEVLAPIIAAVPPVALAIGAIGVGVVAIGAGLVSLFRGGSKTTTTSTSNQTQPKMATEVLSLHKNVSFMKGTDAVEALIIEWASKRQKVCIEKVVKSEDQGDEGDNKPLLIKFVPQSNINGGLDNDFYDRFFRSSNFQTKNEKENFMNFYIATYDGVDIVHAVDAILTPHNLPNAPRGGQPSGAGRRMDKLGRLPRDEIGHLLAFGLGGAHKLMNLVPQSFLLNRGAGSLWKLIENYLMKVLKTKPVSRIYWRLGLVYDGDLHIVANRRPKAFKLSFEIVYEDGEVEKMEPIEFKNE